MNPTTLRRISIAALILAVLVAIDGLYMTISNYHPDDTSSNTLHMSDGTTVLIAAALLLIVAIAAFVISRRPQIPATEVEPAAVPPTEEQNSEVHG